MTHTTETTPGLLALAERVEAATGPDGELFFAAFALCFPENYMEGRSGIGPARWQTFERFVLAGAWLDAAMTLVPEGYVVGSLKQRTRYEIVEAKNNSVDLSEQAAWSAWVHKDTNDRTFRVGLRFSHHGAAATPALALCAAALRAREILRRKA